jgi:hypothetical protein
MFLLDTNVVSAVDDSELFLSVLVAGDSGKA